MKKKKINLFICIAILTLSFNVMFAKAYVPYEVYITDLEEIKGDGGYFEEEWLDPEDEGYIGYDSGNTSMGYDHVEYKLWFSSSIEGDDFYALHLKHTLNDNPHDLVVRLCIDDDDDGELDYYWDCGSYDTGTYTYYGYTASDDIIGVHCFSWKFLNDFEIDIDTVYMSCRAY